MQIGKEESKDVGLVWNFPQMTLLHWTKLFNFSTYVSFVKCVSWGISAT